MKSHPCEQLPISARNKTGQSVTAILPLSPSSSSSIVNPTFSATVGSVSSLPHNCPHCHKQYASNAKLLQHQRKVHLGELPEVKPVHFSQSLVRQLKNAVCFRIMLSKKPVTMEKTALVKLLTFKKAFTLDPATFILFPQTLLFLVLEAKKCYPQLTRYRPAMGTDMSTW